QVTKIPAALQAVVSTEGSLDREALSAAAAGLAQQVVSLRQQLEVVGRDYDLPDVQDDSSPHIRCTARDLAAWTDTQVVALAREAATVNRLGGLLAEGQDIPLAKLPAKLRAVTELAQLRTQITRLRDRLGLREESRRLEDRDWSQFRERAESLLRFLAAWGHPLPRPIVQGLTMTEARSRLAGAVKG